MDTAVFEMILQAISTVGFPIFVAVWLLWRDSKRMREFTEILIELKAAIEALSRRLE